MQLSLRMTYAQTEADLITSLQQLYDVDESATIANWVLEDITLHNRQQRRRLKTEIVSPEMLDQLETAKLELLQHKPVQYVLGYSWFCNMKFLVNEAVLIPRPETEELVEWIVNRYKNNTVPLQVLDIGTGSGCIPITIKKMLPNAIVSSLDVSSEALQLAEKNAEINNAEVLFFQINFLNETNWQLSGKYDVIVSNPPYIPIQEKASLNKNVTAWEPELALFVPDNDPLLFYKKIAGFGKIHLQNGGTLFMETHQDYAGAVKELFICNGYTTELKKDMHGNERMIRVTRS